MTNEKNISSQIHEYHNIVAELAKEGDVLPESFVTQCLVEKLPDSWKEYKLHFKQKKTFMSLQQTIVHIKIEERNRSLEKTSKAKELVSKANIVQDKPPHNYKKQDHRPKGNNQNKRKGQPLHSQGQKKKINCFNCGKLGHYAVACKQRNNNDNNKGSTSKNKANVVQVEEIIAAVVSEAHMVTGVKGWAVDSTCTRHICVYKEELSSYTPIEEGTEWVYVGDNRSVPDAGKGKALIKLTSSKTLSLSNVLHVPHFRHNLISVCLVRPELKLPLMVG
jgi:hypothetical protein